MPAVCKHIIQVLFMLISVIVCAYTQNVRLDSLKLLLTQQSKDTNYVNILNRIGSEYSYIGEYDKAKPYFEKSKQLAIELSFNTGLLASYNGSGIVLRNKGEHKAALKDYFTALELAQQTSNIRMTGILNSNVGRVYVNMGDYPKAIEYFYLALKIFQNIGDKSKTANVLRGIGQIYLLQKDAKARYCFVQALRLYQEIGIYDGIAGSLNDLGKYYVGIGNQSKALEIYFQSLEASKYASYETEKANSHNNIGIIYANQKKYASARENYLISLQLYQKLNNNEEVAKVYNNLGSLEFTNNNYEQSLEYYQSGLQAALLSGVLQPQQNIHEGLSKVYDRLSQPANALAHYKSFIEVKDQIFNDENTKKLLRVELDYEMEMKEQALKYEQDRITSKLQQERIQRYFLIVSIAFLLLFGLFLFQRLSLKQKLKVSGLRNKIAIDLHDEVGSALSSISMYAGIAQMNKKAEANLEIIDKIGKTSRETIENMSDIVWSIQPQNDNFKFVLDKMLYFGNHMMVGAGIEFKFNYPNELEHLVLNMEQRKNLYLIYKEAINNAAKYSQATIVNVQLEKNKKHIVLAISDNGIGFELPETKMGNGLKNMKERAIALNGSFELTSQLGKGVNILVDFKVA